MAALRAVSKSPVLYAELPYTQHAFDVLPSVRSAHAVAAVVRFLEGVRSARRPTERRRPRTPGASLTGPGHRRGPRGLGPSRWPGRLGTASADRYP